MNPTAIEIKKTIEELVQMQSVVKHFEILKASIVEKQNELAIKRNELDKEQDDIEALEKLSVTSIFHKVLGNKETQLEKERQEYLALAMKVKELNKTIELSEFELSIVEKKYQNNEILKQKLESLKTQRAEEIINHNESSKATLVNLMKESDDLTKFIKELKEAFDAGEIALKRGQTTLSHLNEAIHYGQYDMMGHNSADYSKHSHLDRATEHAYHTQQALQLYNRELLDVGVSDKYLHLNVESFDRFTDTFIDNLISDWIIQNKIKNTYNVLDSLVDKISLIQQSIQSSVGKHQEKLLEIRKAIDHLLVSV
jgi:hypothetical protein